MGSFKNQKDKVVGNAKEKIGEILNKENLIDEGRTQSETAEEKEKQYQARIDEIEDQQAEKEAKQQDLTQERKIRYLIVVRHRSQKVNAFLMNKKSRNNE